MRYLLGLVITVLVVTCFILFWPTEDTNNDNTGIQNSSSETIQSQVANSDPIEKVTIKEVRLCLLSTKF